MEGISNSNRRARDIDCIDNPKLGLQINHYKQWLSSDEQDYWWNQITKEVRWYRVRYKSRRFGSECETPCWTTFFGGVFTTHPNFSAIPKWFRPLVSEVSSSLGGCPFNAVLIRLYFESDEIAWHTDVRCFR